MRKCPHCGKRGPHDCCRLGWDGVVHSFRLTTRRFTGGMLDRDPKGCVEQVVAALNGQEVLPFTDITDLVREE